MPICDLCGLDKNNEAMFICLEEEVKNNDENIGKCPPNSFRQFYCGECIASNHHHKPSLVVNELKKHL
jgi:hypothetical protein